MQVKKGEHPAMSKKFTRSVYLDDWLIRRIEEKARKENRSFNWIVQTILQSWAQTRTQKN
jgi:hypothetical protein